MGRLPRQGDDCAEGGCVSARVYGSRENLTRSLHLADPGLTVYRALSPRIGFRQSARQDFKE